MMMCCMTTHYNTWHGTANVNCLDDVAMNATDILDQLTPELSHDMGILASIGIWMLPRHGILASRNNFDQRWANVTGIWATFQA